MSGKRKYGYSSGNYYSGSNYGRKAKRMRRSYQTVNDTYRSLKRLRGLYRRTGLYGRFYGSGGARLTGEKKYHDVTFNSVNFANTGTTLIDSIVKIQSGVLPTEKLGKKIWIRSIELKGRIRWGWHENTAIENLQDSGVMRMAMILDTQTNGAAATYTDVYQTSSPYSPRNMENSNRFKVLKEWFVVANSKTLTFNQAELEFVSSEHLYKVKYFKKCNIVIDYVPTNSGISVGIAQIKSNNIFLVASTTTQESALCSFGGLMRVRFDDA